MPNPSTYEILNPSDFGLTRYIHFANRLTGWNAIKSRVDQLNLHLTDEQCKEVTNKIKKLGDVRSLNIDDVDSIIKDFHADLTTPAVRPTIGEPVPHVIEGLDESAAKRAKQ